MRPLASTPKILSVLLAAALSAPAAAAENLVSNGDFREGVSSWSRLDLVSYSAGGAATPGSARITLPSRPEGGDAMLQCVAVEGFRLYDLGAAVRLPEWPGHSGGVSVRLRWHALPNCQGPSLRGAPSLDFSYTEPAGWQVKEKRRKAVLFMNWRFNKIKILLNRVEENYKFTGSCETYAPSYVGFTF